MRRPREPSFSNPKKTKNPNPSPIGNRFGFFLFGGRGWIRTTEAESSRFTVCPHWPLGNTPIFFCASYAGRLVYFSMKHWICQLLFSAFFCAGTASAGRRALPGRKRVDFAVGSGGKTSPEAQKNTAWCSCRREPRNERLFRHDNARMLCPGGRAAPDHHGGHPGTGLSQSLFTNQNRCGIHPLPGQAAPVFQRSFLRVS